VGGGNIDDELVFHFGLGLEIADAAVEQGVELGLAFALR
jgi:hypothetical protein